MCSHCEYFGHCKYNESKYRYLLYLVNGLIDFPHIFKTNIFRSQSVALGFHVFIGFFIFQLQEVQKYTETKFDYDSGYTAALTEIYAV